METLFGSGAPIWTALPPVGVTYQMPVAPFQAPLAIGKPIIGTPALGPPAVPFPYAGSPPGSLAGPEGMLTLTAPSLLAAVAMRRGQPQGPTSDQEVEDFIIDALDLLPGAADVEVRCEGSRVTLSGSVQHKRVKHDVGEIAWAIPALSDVQNNVTIAPRRRARAAGREIEAPPTSGPVRKQS